MSSPDTERDSGMLEPGDGYKRNFIGPDQLRQKVVIVRGTLSETGKDATITAVTDRIESELRLAIFGFLQRDKDRGAIAAIFRTAEDDTGPYSNLDVLRVDRVCDADQATLGVVRQVAGAIVTDSNDRGVPEFVDAFLAKYPEAKLILLRGMPGRETLSDEALSDARPDIKARDSVQVIEMSSFVYMDIREVLGNLLA